MKTIMKTTNTNLKNFLALLAITIVLVFSSCSNNEDDNLEENSENLSEIVMQDFVEEINNLSVPSALMNSNNQYAQEANAQFESLKSLSTSFSSLFVIPDYALSTKTSSKVVSKSSSSNTQTYSWSSGDTTVEYTITEASDRYSFTYYVTSPDFTGKLMAGYQLIDGSYAEVNLYYDNIVESTIKWWVNDEDIKIELSSDDFKLILESNATDNSGNLKVYYSNTLTALYEWNADGTGTYTNYYTNETYSW
ncbi:hypothetical protein [Polaribacter ponticola]|uniref:Uncharacterized protein n=1 Tax=Polaribacter ponticola TaxID=2978475 RepID=A0ABT5SBA2_9FLAO|nr:hypothetical protein [Polaribacter sp. MSW5]MDD7915399.1 hypothetical protein [Polaribacter sp. MSW5]